MRTRHAPRLAVALLDWCLPDDEAIAGDLVEEFARRQSRLWFWYQALLAIAIRLWAEPREIRPLKLVEHPSYPLRQPVARAVPRPINLTASPIEGVGGLGLLVLGTVVTLVQPAIWLGVLLAWTAGVAWGLLRIRTARRREDEGPGGDGRVLFRTPDRPVAQSSPRFSCSTAYAQARAVSAM